MRTPDEIHSMIDYLEQKDKSHPDIAVLRWALKEDQRPVDIARGLQDEAVSGLHEVIAQHCATIADLRQKLARFVQPPSRG